MVKSSAFLFIGEGGYLKEKAIEDLASSILNGSSRQLDYKVFYGGESDSRELLDYISTIPFLAPKRVAVIKDFEKLSKDDALRIIAYLKKPSKSTCLVLETKDDSVLKEYDEIGSYVNIQIFGNMPDYELLSWIKQFVAVRRKTIKEDAVAELKELQGNNLSILSQELEKLITFIGERHSIELSDVEELVGKSLTLSAFGLTAAIEKNKSEEAMRVVSDLVLGGKKHYEIIGLLCWHFNRLLKAKTLQAKGEDDQRIAAMLRINRRHSADFFGQLDSFSLDQIRSKMRLLLEADLDIKTSRFDPELLLEFAVIRLCLR